LGFRYLNKHFWINQLTSYRSLSYATLRAGLTDRLVPSHAYVQKPQAGAGPLPETLLAGAVPGQPNRRCTPAFVSNSSRRINRDNGLRATSRPPGKSLEVGYVRVF
jgi:hypothetical protein